VLFCVAKYLIYLEKNSTARWLYPEEIYNTSPQIRMLKFPIQLGVPHLIINEGEFES